MHLTGALPAVHHGRKRLAAADIPQVALCHAWDDNLLLWIEDQPIILRDVKDIRRGKDGAWEIAAGRMCLPWNAIRAYTTAYYRQTDRQVLRVSWAADKFPYPDKIVVDLPPQAPLCSLRPVDGPAPPPWNALRRWTPSGGTRTWPARRSTSRLAAVF